MYVDLKVGLCLCRGHIPIKFADYQKVVQSKRTNNLVKLKFYLKTLLKARKDRKLQFLNKFSSLYHYLLTPLFE